MPMHVVTMPRCRKILDDTINSNVCADFNTTEEVTLELEPHSEIDEPDFSKTKIYKQLRPLLVCMRLFGLYFKRYIDHRGSSRIEPAMFWCFLITFLMIVNVLRSFTLYRLEDEFDHMLVQKLLFTIWSGECTLKMIILTVHCYRQDGLPQFFREWRVTCRDDDLDSLSRRMMIKYIILAFLFILVNSVVFIIALMYLPILEEIYLDVVWRNARQLDTYLLSKIILGVLALFNSASSMFPVSLFVVASCAVGKQLAKFSDEFADSDHDISGRIEDFRLRHQYLCNLVEILDKVFAPMIAAVFMANVPMFCLVLYTMVTSVDIHISLVFINLFWLCFILLQMSIVTVTAAWVNVKAHSPLERIYTLRFSKTSNDVQLQMHMFLSRLTGTQIGFTAMRLFVIDRPTILTIAGMMVTYYLLLIQFKMPVVTLSDCTCNITGTVAMDNQTLEIVQL